jgi:hypothetical protein
VYDRAVVRTVAFFVVGGVLAACGDDGGSGGATGGGDTGGSGVGVECGDALSCDATQACVERANEPTCTDKAGPEDPCPEGQVDTLCGGVGSPCCCEPPPPPDYSCVDADGCAGEVSCACLTDPCEGGLECVDTATPGTVLCEMLPVP